MTKKIFVSGSSKMTGLDIVKKLLIESNKVEIKSGNKNKIYLLVFLHSADYY